MMNGYYQPRRRHGGMWLVFLIIVVGIIIYANSKGIINLSSINLGNFSLSGNQTNSVQSCLQKVDSCGNTINLKYGSNVTVLGNLQAQNSNDANQFLGIWKGSSQSGNISNYNASSYPIIMVATRFDNSNGVKSPYIFICKSDGSIEENTNSGLC